MKSQVRYSGEKIKRVITGAEATSILKAHCNVYDNDSDYYWAMSEKAEKQAAMQAELLKKAKENSGKYESAYEQQAAALAEKETEILTKLQEKFGKEKVAKLGACSFDRNEELCVQIWLEHTVSDTESLRTALREAVTKAFYIDGESVEEDSECGIFLRSDAVSGDWISSKDSSQSGAWKNIK